MDRSELEKRTREFALSIIAMMLASETRKTAKS